MMWWLDVAVMRFIPQNQTISYDITSYIQIVWKVWYNDLLVKLNNQCMEFSTQQSPHFVTFDLYVLVYPVG